MTKKSQKGSTEVMTLMSYFELIARPTYINLLSCSFSSQTNFKENYKPRRLQKKIIKAKLKGRETESEI